MSGGEHETLRIAVEGAVQTVELSRPEVHDAFDETMVAELTAVFRALADAPDIRVVVLRSAGNHFCAGADLNWMRRMADYSPEENVADAAGLDDMFRAIVDCPKPVVARVQGAALGGGAGLVTAADIAIASERAQLGFTEVRLGILPAVIAPYVLQKVPPGRAQAFFLTGERISAERAESLGLVHRVVPHAELDEAVGAVVEELLQASPQAQAAVKPLVRQVSGRSLDEARGITTRAIAEARASADGRYGMAAFLEKRLPEWVPRKGEKNG